ncbi:hypothetical protein [Bradyrhizobium sp. RT4b]|uniref:Pam3-gp28 family putative phage holin n=1 Tax=unclassified Bradyrhizobium TaxID=2631580 RepID=UPI003391E712
MTSDQVMGVIRAILAAIGGFILAKGWVSAETWTWIAGGIVTIGGALWSLWSNRPAGLAGAAQKIDGVNVVTSPSAAPAVQAAVAAAK